MISQKTKYFTAFLSFFLVAFGQPAWSPLFSVIASLVGYALFWRVLLDMTSKKQRFFWGWAWFSAVQLVQLCWFLTHPFSYIYAVWLLFSLAVGAQFGLISLLMTRERVISWRGMLTIASCWTIFEWSRLFFFSGYVWNPVGLALAGSDYGLQWAAVAGSYGLSFWVILTNLLALRVSLVGYAIRPLLAFCFCGLLPLVFGAAHIAYHTPLWEKAQQNSARQISALLVQTAFPVQASLRFSSRSEQIDHLFAQWDRILGILAKQRGKQIDLILFPEIVISHGAYSGVYPYERMKELFVKWFGKTIEERLPKLESPLAYLYRSADSPRWVVNNAYWVQALANLFDADIVIGLEDAEDIDEQREYYSAALYVVPESRREGNEFSAERYAKRVLVPMGEYIPLSFFRELAARYGVYGSFCPGAEAVVWRRGEVVMSPSICYEEMFGGLISEGRRQGANLILNLTNDAWFPGPLLMRQHLEHARLRTVENGVPLLRACNTGITCLIDPLGREVASLGEDDRSRETVADSLHVTLGLYDYRTLYERIGDEGVIGFCFFCLMGLNLRRRRSS